ncbi:MAG TPA: hypothetical protein VF659_03630 [Pyrinomonadaceae bacterium]
MLRAVVEHSSVQSREYDGAFVLMQYHGHLRRDPEPAISRLCPARA